MRSPVLVVGALAGGLLTSQYPEYAQQYTQRLGGAVEELHTITEQFDADARQQNLSREAAIETYKTSTDKFLNQRGQSMGDVFARYENLKAHQEALQNAGPVEEVTAFAQHLDPKLLQDTWQEYTPAVPFTTKGLIFTGIGLVLGYGLLRLIWAIAALPARRRKRVRVTS